MRFSTNAHNTPASEIREVVHRALQLDGVVRLEIGERSLTTPRHIVNAALSDAQLGFTHYTANAGYTDLRSAVCDKLARVNNVHATEANVLVTAGGVQGLFLIFAAICDPGDSVLVPDPSWPNYKMICGVLGLRCETYPCPAVADFLPELAELESRITPRTRLLVVNSPNNPSGRIYPRPLIEEIAAIARRRGVILIGDEAYDEIYYGDSPIACSSLGAIEDGEIVSVFSFSKTYAMTGWRVGYVVGPESLIALLSKLQEPIISAASSISQRAALAALRGDQSFTDKQRQTLLERRDAILELLTKSDDFVYRAEGAFYLMLNIAPLESRAFAMQLLEMERIAVAPGSAFGPLGEGFVRICYAAGGDRLQEAVRRLLDRRDEWRESGLPIGAGSTFGGVMTQPEGVR